MAARVRIGLARELGTRYANAAATTRTSHVVLNSDVVTQTGLAAAAGVIGVHLVRWPVGTWLNRTTFAAEVEGPYLNQVTCRWTEEAKLRPLPLQTLSHAGLGLRRLESTDIPGNARVTVTAHATAPTRNHPACEQVVWRLSLELDVSAATWRSDRAASET